jgi:hypothetical protein
VHAAVALGFPKRAAFSQLFYAIPVSSARRRGAVAPTIYRGLQCPPTRDDALSLQQYMPAACPECPDTSHPWAKVFRDQATSFFDGQRFWVECGTAHRQEVWGVMNPDFDSPPPPPPPSVHGPMGFDVHMIDTTPKAAYVQVEVKRWVPDFPLQLIFISSVTVKEVTHAVDEQKLYEGVATSSSSHTFTLDDEPMRCLRPVPGTNGRGWARELGSSHTRRRASYTRTDAAKEEADAALANNEEQAQAARNKELGNKGPDPNAWTYKEGDGGRAPDGSNTRAHICSLS